MSGQEPESSRLGLGGRSLLLAAFFLSGAASLIFEVVWTRRLVLVLGATATAMGAVLGAFMGGMAIGSALAGHRSIGRRNPVLVYALLEGWAGLYGLATPYLLGGVTGASPLSQFGLALAVLLPATIAMGASLPVLSRALGEGSSRPAVEVGRLYALNTAGAVVGPLLCAFWLFPAFGLGRTLHIAAFMDLVVCAGLALGRRAFARWETKEEPVAASGTRAVRPRPLLLVALAVSGATAMVYEVAWTRTLSMVYGSSIYGVTIMLSTFLLGIAGGSALASTVLRRRRRPAPTSVAGWLLAASAGAAFVSLLTARSLPVVFVSLYRSSPEHDLALFITQFAVSAALLLPGTLCLGAMLPFATSASAARGIDLGGQVSWLYTANLVGSAAGALVATAVLIGSFGIESSVRTACTLALGVALVIVASARPARLSTIGLATLAGGTLFVLGFDPSGEPVAKGMGFYSDARFYERYDTRWLREQVAAHRLLYYRDGPVATVSVQKLDRYLLLQINGKTDASTGLGDMETQLLLAHLPFMVAEAKRVAVVGWGCGMTAGAVLLHPVESVDAFEIEPAVVEASRFFDEQNGRPLEDPRLNLILGDARTHLRKHEVLYDLIISEPSNPWITGVANLFTQDFFRLLASRLEPDGILCQWFHLYGMSEESTRSLLATFRSVFPHTLVFRDRDLILLGAERPIRFAMPHLRELFERPEIRASLSRIFVRYPFDILAGLRLDEQGSEDFSRGAPINTDDNMLLELAAPRSLYRDEVEAIRARMALHSRSAVDLVLGYRSRAEVYLELAASQFTAGRKEEALLTCRQGLEIETSFEGEKLLGQILQGMGSVKEARDALERALALGGDPEGRRFVEALLRSLGSPAAP